MFNKFKNKLTNLGRGKKELSSGHRDEGSDTPLSGVPVTTEPSTSTLTLPTAQSSYLTPVSSSSLQNTTQHAGAQSPIQGDQGDQADQPSVAASPARSTLPLASIDIPGGPASQFVTLESSSEYHYVSGSPNPQFSSPSPTTSKLPDATTPLEQSPSIPTWPLARSSSVQTTQSWVKDASTSTLKALKILAVITGAPTLESCVDSLEERQVIMEKEDLEKYFNKLTTSIESLQARQGVLEKADLENYLYHLMELIVPLTEEDGSSASQKLKDELKGLYSSLSDICDQVREGEDDHVFLERMGREVTQSVDSFTLVNCISGIIKLTGTLVNVEKHVLGHYIQNLRPADAAYDDYKSTKKSGGCLEGTRETLLREIAAWIATLGLIAQIYLLSGIAGTGKSTIAYTIAERAKQSGYLGASFFFSGDEDSRSNAERFFTTIAFQLCLYDEEFAEAIEKALSTKEGAAAVTKRPDEQLTVLILDPLRDILRSRSSPIVIVVDALDECVDEDSQDVLAGLNRLVDELPCFKVVVTTRPHPRLPPNLSAHKVFYLQDIEAKIINRDIHHYLKYKLSQPSVGESVPGITWCASDEEIDSVVRVADKLFIVASTAVRFILDTDVYNPKSQMEALKAGGNVSLDGLGSFYNLILQRAVRPDKPILARRFKVIIGTILVAQEPLPIQALEHLTHPWSIDDIKGALVNLQSVVVLDHDTPRIYHKSFFDFLTDAHHCTDDLRIDMKTHHTRAAIRCLQIMNEKLKQNILDLGTPARFMDNEQGLAAENVTAEKLTEKIPRELRYACIYWTKHVASADTEDVSLTKEVDTFLREHLSHWLEVLSWIRKFDMAYGALRVIGKKLTSSNLRGIIPDALRFIQRFSQEIHQSALHIYYSALPCTPPDCLLYKSYSKETVRGLCQVEGIPPQWDALITYFSQGHNALHPVFSHDNSKIASTSWNRREMRLWDAKNGMLLRSYGGDNSAIADDFSVAAVSQAQAVTLWSVASNVHVITVTPSEKVVELTLSFDGSRLAVGLSNDTVDLWDVQEGKMIAILEGYAHDGGQLGFAPRGHRLAFVSNDGTIRLWNGGNGECVARLDYESRKHVKFCFSRNSRRLGSLVDEDDGCAVTLWDGETGVFIDVAGVVYTRQLVISDDGSVIAAEGLNYEVQLWSGNPLLLVGAVDIGGRIDCLAISGNILAIGSVHVDNLTLYDVNNHSVIVMLQRLGPRCLSLSPDSTRLAIGNFRGGALYDVPLLKTSFLASQEQPIAVTALAFSPDSSRLASAFNNGAVALWDTSRTDHPITSYKLHFKRVSALAFSPDGKRFSSGSRDRTVRFWDGKDGAPISKLEHSFIEGAPISIASSPDLLAVAATTTITLFDHQSLYLVDTLDNGGRSLSFCEDGSLLASASPDDRTRDVTVWNVAERTAIATFTVESTIHRLWFSPNGSQLAVQLTYEDGRFEFFDVVNKHAFELTGSEDLSWLPNFMNGVLISWKFDRTHRDRLIGRFSGHHDWIPILYVPEDVSRYGFRVGSSIIALGCTNGRIVFVKFPPIAVN